MEEKRKGADGFTGYSEHQCRDFDAAFRFAETWRVFEGKDGSGRRREGKGEEDDEDD